MTRVQGHSGFSFAVDGYPRVRECLAPSRLSDYLTQPVPAWLANRSTDYQCLCDLDASIWDCVSDAEVAELADLVVESISIRADEVARDIGRAPLLQVTLHVADVPVRLSPETIDVLTALGASVSWPYKTRVADLLTHGRDTARALVDVLTSLEYWGFGRDSRWKLQACLSGMARRAELLLGNNDVASTDPRLGATIQSLRKGIPRQMRYCTIAEALVWLADHAHAVERMDESSDCVRHLVDILEAVASETLSEQVGRVLEAVAGSNRNARILLRRHGLDGRPPATLQRVADGEGLTRERVRQICDRTERQLAGAHAQYAPMLDEALALLDQSAPMTAEAALDLIRVRIRAPGIVDVGAVFRAARLLNRNINLELRDAGSVSWVCHADDAIMDDRPMSSIRTRAGRLCDSSGATTIEALLDALRERDGLELSADELVTFLPHFPGFEWLDRDLGWFWMTGRKLGRNRFFNLLTKVLSVAGRLGLDDVRSALRRSRRLAGPFPPTSVLRQLCERYPGFHLEGDDVCSDSELDHRVVLRGTELYVVELLMQLGNVARVEDMWQIAGSEGIGRVSFWATLQDSPAIMKYARSTYGLRGLPTPATEIWEVANKRVTRANSVLRDWGRHAGAAYWMIYRLSDRAAQSGQLSVPGEWSAEIDGEYSACFRQMQIPGAVVIRDRSMCGLRRLFGLAEAEQGDWALVVVDLSSRSVYARIGDEELALSDDADIAELLAAGREPEPKVVTAASEAAQPPLFSVLSEADEVEECGEILNSDVDLVREVLGRAHRPLKAREIASAIRLFYGETLDRRGVNHILYGVLRHEVEGRDGLWALSSGRVKLSEEG